MSEALRRVWRNLDGSMSFKMGPHCCVALCPCQLRPGESQPSIASMDDFNAYAEVYPPLEGEHSAHWQERVIREGRRIDVCPCGKRGEGTTHGGSSCTSSAVVERKLRP